MKRKMVKMKEKGKWLLAFTLCLSCLILCASLMVGPTFAEENPAAATTDPAASSTVTTVPTTSTAISTTAGLPKYAAVTGFKNVYEVLSSTGQKLSPQQFIYSFVKPEDGKAIPNSAQTVYQKGTAYYVAFPEGSGLFVSVTASGSFDFSKSIYWGEDEKFNTADDKDTVIKEEEGYFYLKEADGIWKIIQGIFNPLQTTTAAATSTSVSAASSSAAETSSTTNGSLTTSVQTIYPKTGLPMITFIMVCMALLVMVSVYCGVQIFRRRTVKTH